MSIKIGGWISLHRNVLNHWTWKRSKKKSAFEAWVYLLLAANHKSAKVYFDSEVILVERGGLITSMLKLSTAWNWSQERVKTFLISLQDDSMITLKVERRKTLISIVYYDSYQTCEKSDRELTENSPRTDRELTENSPRTDRELTETNNNDTNNNNTNNKILNSLNARARDMPQSTGTPDTEFLLIPVGATEVQTPRSGSLGTLKLKFSVTDWEALRVNYYHGDTRALTSDVLAASDHLAHSGGTSYDPVAYMRNWRRRKFQFERPATAPKTSAQDSQRESIQNLVKLYGGES